MTRQDKAKIIDELVEKFSNTEFFYVTDASGLSVQETNDFRRACVEKGVEYKVYKNTLMQKALQKLDADYTEFNEKVLKGFSGVLFSTESNNVPAKIIKNFRKKGFERPILKGASIESAIYIGDDQLDTLSKLKSKHELIGDIIGLLQSPATSLIGSLQSGKHKIAGIVKTLSEKES